MSQSFTLTSGLDTFTGLPGGINDFFFTPATLHSTDTVTGVGAGPTLDQLDMTTSGLVQASQFAGVTTIEQLNLMRGDAYVELTDALIAGSSAGYFGVRTYGDGSYVVDASATSAERAMSATSKRSCSPTARITSR